MAFLSKCLGRQVVSILFASVGAALSLLLMSGQANAACIRFQETRTGDAYLVNACQFEINAAYGLTDEGEWMPEDAPLVRVRVASDGRKLLWTDANRPFGGRYKIKVFSCMAPSTLVYPAGGRATCQVSYADAG